MLFLVMPYFVYLSILFLALCYVACLLKLRFHLVYVDLCVGLPGATREAREGQRLDWLAERVLGGWRVGQDRQAGKQGGKKRGRRARRIARVSALLASQAVALPRLLTPPPSPPCFCHVKTIDKTTII